MFGKEKVKNITVSPNDGYIMWNVDIGNIARDAVLDVQTGCAALYIVNGSLKSYNTSGRWLINGKDEIKIGGKLQLIGVNSDRIYTILCGAGGIPFRDYELNTETTAGANGECKIRLIQPWTLYTLLGKPDVTSDDLDAFVRGKLSELLSASLADEFSKYDYNTVNARLTAISEGLKNKVFESLSACGLMAEDFSLNAIYFSEEYKLKRAENFERSNRKKEEKAEQRERERAQRAEIDAIRSLAGVDLKDRTADAKSGGAELVRYCARCGAKTEKDALYCPSCGVKLS